MKDNATVNKQEKIKTNNDPTLNRVWAQTNILDRDVFQLSLVSRWSVCDRFSPEHKLTKDLRVGRQLKLTCQFPTSCDLSVSRWLKSSTSHVCKSPKYSGSGRVKKNFFFACVSVVFCALYSTESKKVTTVQWQDNGLDLDQNMSSCPEAKVLNITVSFSAWLGFKLWIFIPQGDFHICLSLQSTCIYK